MPQRPTPPHMPEISNGGFDPRQASLHTEMLSCVSHDLKTPMASIIGSLEVLDRMKVQLTADKHDALVQLALQEAYRLDNFITNILDMDRLENGVIQPNYEPVDINGLIKNCLMRLSPNLQDCEVRVQNDSSLITTTDPLLLGRVVCLVLDNAAKYRSAKPVITIDYGKESAVKAFIRIEDNGQGIPADQIDVIFSKFARFAKKDRQNAGTGLGLSIGRAIMALLNGSITAQSRVGESTVFTLTFPA